MSELLIKEHAYMKETLWEVDRPVEIIRVPVILVHVLIPLKFVWLVLSLRFLPMVMFKYHCFVMPIELICELPHVRVEPSEYRESSRPYPYIHEPVRARMGHPRVTSIRIPKVLLHFRSFTLFFSSLTTTSQALIFTRFNEKPFLW